MKICVTGGREYFDFPKVCVVLDGLFHPVTLLIHGGASGADAQASQWAVDRKVPQEVFAADWRQFGPAAGPIRNQQMVDDGFDMLVAFPGGKGTADMIRRTRKAGIRILHNGTMDLAEDSGAATHTKGATP